ncbi:hypothetical protein niasHS_014874 [Heterodera schachtii]|uniref:EXPERA domain-containing protein n=1 Tax=Heterodera schachtii TaxID=97005 RepID=A0ABD2IIY8_HETSC
MGGTTAAFGVLPNWVKIWLVCSTLICSVDVAFTALRPESLRGGKYDNFFTLWNVYASVDTRYADAADPLTRVTGPLMCLELVLNVCALCLDFVCPAHSLMAAFLSNALVFWKTSIYLSLFLLPNEEAYRSLDHGTFPPISFRGIAPQTPFWKEMLLFWAPNSVWVFVPLFAMFHLWAKIARGWNGQSEERTDFNMGKYRKAMKNGKMLNKCANELRELCALDELDPMEAAEESGKSAKNGQLMPKQLKLLVKTKSASEKKGSDQFNSNEF